MVKQSIETIGGWLNRNSWAMIVVVGGIIGGGVITAAVQQNQIKTSSEKVSKLETKGSDKSHQNSERIKALETTVASQTEMIKEVRDDIKILLGR